MNLNITLKTDLHKICLKLAQEKIDTCKSVLHKINEAKLSDTRVVQEISLKPLEEMLQGEEDRTKATLSNAVMLKNKIKSDRCY